MNESEKRELLALLDDFNRGPVPDFGRVLFEGISRLAGSKPVTEMMPSEPAIQAMRRRTA